MPERDIESLCVMGWGVREGEGGHPQNSFGQQYAGVIPKTALGRITVGGGGGGRHPQNGFELHYSAMKTNKYKKKHTFIVFCLGSGDVQRSLSTGATSKFIEGLAPF